MTDTEPPPQPNVDDLLDEPASLIRETDWLTESGWEPFALEEVIRAAQRRLDGVPLTEELETLLRLAIRLPEGQFTVSSGLALIDDLPDLDPLDRDRPAEPQCRRNGVQHLASAVEAGSEEGRRR